MTANRLSKRLASIALGALLSVVAPAWCAAAPGADGNLYRLTLTASDLRSLSVEARIAVTGDELTMDWASAGFLEDGWATYVRDLKAFDPDGAEIQLEYRRPGRWKLARALPTVRLTYDIRLEHDLISWEEGGHDESAYVLDQLAFFVGKAAFVMGGQSETTISDERFVVEFDVPAGWDITTPWERLPGDGHRFVATGPRALIGAGVLVGRQERRVVRVAGLEVVFAVGQDYVEVLPILEQLFEPLVPAALELFDSTPGSKFVFIANLAPRTETISPYFSGGVLDRTMSFIAPGPPSPEMLPVLTYIVTHEFLHLWNGSLIQAADTEREYWFSEGFTDYLTIRLLHAMGVLSQDQMLGGPHGFLDNYDSYLAVAGPVSMREAGLAKEDNYDLVYSGGFVFGLVLDLELRRRVDGGVGIVALMRELARRATTAGSDAKPVALDDLKRLAGELAGVDLGALFRDFVEGVGVIEIDEHLAHAGLRIRRSDESSTIEPVVDATPAQLAVRSAFLAPVCCANLGSPSGKEAVLAGINKDTGRTSPDSRPQNPSPSPDSAPALHEQGRSLLADGRTDEAIARFKLAIELEPNSAEHQLWLGYAYLEQFESAGLFKQSSLAGKIRSAYETAVKLDPDHVEARVALANYYREAPAIVGGGKKKARAQIEEILKRDPAQGHLALAELEAAENNHDAAVREYGLVLDAEPGNAEAWVGLGFLHQGRERWHEAFLAFENALLGDPETAEAHYQIGRTGALSGQNLERAVEALQVYIDRYSASEGYLAAACWRLGMLYEHLGRNEQAGESYRRALEVDPGYDSARKALKRLGG